MLHPRPSLRLGVAVQTGMPARLDGRAIAFDRARDRTEPGLERGSCFHSWIRRHSELASFTGLLGEHEAAGGDSAGGTFTEGVLVDGECDFD